MTVAMQVNRIAKKKIEKTNQSWVKTDLKSDLPEWSPDDTNVENLLSRNLIPKGYSKLFFDDEILNVIVEETNRYA